MAIKTKSKQVVFTIFSLGIVFYSQVALASITSPLGNKKGMVVSAHPLASDAGITMLRKGGNAVDAAVATTFAISVVEPFSAGIGGGGFLLIHSGKTGEIKALDFRERAPLKATKDMYLDGEGKVRPHGSVTGYLAVATPGTVAGMYEVHRRYGKLPWSEVLKPAIALAQHGFILRSVLSPNYFTDHQTRLETMLNNPGMRKIFTRDGDFYQPGERLVQRDLAWTLTEIARYPQSFYTGNIARAIASDMAKNGGLITLQDLKAYKPIWRTPVCGQFRQAKICSMPPPSSGGVHLLQMLNIIGDTDLKSLGWHHPDGLHLMVEAMKIAYADRSEYLGDPDFIKVPVAQLISPSYAKKRRQQIDMERAKPTTEVKPGDLRSFPTSHSLLGSESTETSHLTVVDEQRDAVSLTFTINLNFGAGVVTPGTGIVLNNEMDDFAIAPGVPNAFGLVGNEANAIAPRKTPLSSMTPTIITENGRLRLALGTPGGSTIITQVLQIILNVLEHDMDIGAALSVPRIHHQWLPDQLRVERWGLDTLTLQELRRRGHNIKESDSWGNANAIAVTADGDLEAAADPRGEGFPRGL
ncbi:gamma-glutamyltransferase [Umezakia ovalisporum]|uniref:Glutathione hydrolase proenzyme n=1 Tax=Umezakia ovalisporum FSS-43 TaxID=2740520 RepID=A0ABT6K3E2_9CYAN|nr:gamma-glutamyltransferase [Umezakia ovalisporum]MDH6056892.1 gamma-glutamyltransferase [Umezakia ovalisporum FSS-43]MDH6070932.1 gamma-glutamyltransferase [Umezakia ovalisporum CobakiLakeA]MDH6078504.1 gamma-glutamyltransferase [Umezakia ovalisporum FSS-45]MDH6080288.1 gamma-glutamyltransferase [Umezakia ovalisporum FSS-44]MDH6094573.1 gamma-glutamyltransferase [Umezakia ovalisporum CobakiLakeB]